MATAANDATWEDALDPGGDGLNLEGRRRLRRSLADRDRRASIAFGSAYVATAVLLLATTATTRHPSPLVYLLLIGVYALTARVHFEIGACWALPTQLVLVPMLFTLPLAAVPLCVTAACLVAYPPRRQAFDRVFLVFSSSWHTIGPVLVLLSVSAGERVPQWRHWPIYLAAFGAQLAFDFGTSSLREWFGLAIPPRDQLNANAWSTRCSRSRENSFSSPISGSTSTTR